MDLYRRLRGLSTVSLRLGNVYGPRQDPQGEAGVVAIFCGALLSGTTPTVFGDGTQTRDYVHVSDVVEAFLAAAGSDAHGAYNVGTGRETDVMELGSHVAASCGVPFEPRMAPDRPGEVRRIAIASERAAKEFGWHARTTIDEGIAATVEWARGTEFGRRS